MNKSNNTPRRRNFLAKRFITLAEYYDSRCGADNLHLMALALCNLRPERTLEFSEGQKG
jgi:hypothetical protein